MNSNQQGQSGFDRFADGLASLTRDMATDLHAAYAGVFYGNGAINQPYLTSRSAAEQELGISDLVGGAMDGVGDRLAEMREQLTGRGQDGQEQQLDRGQEHSR